MIKRFFYDFEFEQKGTPNGITIDIISLGMIDENKNGIYLVNKDFDWTKCNNQWLKQHVEKNLQLPNITKNISLYEFKNQILKFINYQNDDIIQLYGYYSAYDHVCLASCFGRMIDLPEYIQMLTYDLKQMMDEKNITKEMIQLLIEDNNQQHNSLSDCYWNIKLFNVLKSIK